MNAKQYQSACRWFNRLNALAGAELEAELADLSKESDELRLFVAEMLEADRLAESDHFLSSDTITRTIEHRGTPGYPGGFPDSIGPYDIKRILGSGGMGVVYEGYDPPTERRVAIKVIQSREFSTNDQKARFRREAIAAASLRHPNIVTVYATGTDGNTDYIVMQLIDGVDLHSVVKQSVLNEQRAARIVSRLCAAVGYAHAKGVVHRDIKPGNVVLTDQDEPVLMDFGLAKTILSDDSHTKTGQIMGTAGFMAPEQAGNAKTAGIPSDVYGLGSTLYFCLTGQAPFTAQTPLSLLQDLRDRAPSRPGSLRIGLHPDLDQVCMRCLEKAPQDRYLSAEALQEDLQRFLSNEPLLKREDSGWQSIGRVINANAEISGGLQSAPAAAWLAAIGLVFHVAVFAVTQLELPSTWVWCCLVFWFVASNAVNYVFHWSRYWQLTPMERQSGIIQLGANCALLTLFAIHGPLSTDQPARVFLAVYPAYTLVLASALVAHGSIYMGRILFAAAFFFPLALLVALFPSWGPILLCVFGTAILIAIDTACRLLGRD